MASGASEAELLAQFQAITGADSERAKFFLDSAQGQLDMALTAFFDGDPEEELAAAASTATPQFSTQPPSSSKKSSSKSGTYSGGSSNIHSLSHAQSDDDDDEEDKDAGQAFYAGGSSTSGQQIIGPPKKGSGQDFVKEMFKRAREQGAEVEEDEGPSPFGRLRNINSFSGTGFKLGSNENDSEVIPSMSKSKQEEREFTLKMWQNGFSLDDGPLRAYDDPANREFLSCIMKGRVPLELIREARGGEVNIKMEDHKHEDYVKPKVSAKPFQGAGHVLGSVLPNMEIESTGTAEDQKNSEEKASEEVKVDESQPSTNLQVRLSNGTRMVVKLNHTHTVGDLRRYITIARPEYATTTFALLTTFPNKELTNDSETLKDAELLGAAILLRPK